MYPELSFSTFLIMMLATNPADATGLPATDQGLCNFAKVVHIRSGAHLTVRSGASRQFIKIDRLSNGAPVYICDERGDWFEISYSDPNGPCGAQSPKGMDIRKANTCKSGWVRKKWIEVLSG
jgi:hypothetical protein